MSSTASIPAAPAVETTARGGWLYRPSIDLLLGAGAGYVLSVPVLVLLGNLTSTGPWPAILGVFLPLLFSTPHYGATILRVYEQRRDRRRYALFSVWATLAICGLFVLGLHQVLLGSLLVTLYVTWSPWHFGAQNYGLALMFLRRRGVPVEPRAKRLLYASFVLSVGLAFLGMHGQQYAGSVASAPSSAGSVFRFLSLRLPGGFIEIAAPLTVLAYLASLGGAGALLLRHARLRDLGPASCLVLVQALWFALPAATRVFADVPLNNLAFTVIWIGAAHAAQYLWVTFYYARREDPSARLGPYLGRALLAGAAVTTIPALLFAPALFGGVPWDAGLALLVFAVVNLHHFVLDGAIWKLRDGRVAQLLLRDTPVEPEQMAAAGPRRSWFRPAILALGLTALWINAIDAWEREVVINRAGSELYPVLKASERLAWIGRDDPTLHDRAAQVLLRRNLPDAAVAEYERSLEIYPTAAAWVGLGQLHARAGEWQRASEAYAAALALDPDDLPALVQAGRAWMELGRPDLARESLEQALALAPNHPRIRQALERAISAQGGDS